MRFRFTLFLFGLNLIVLGCIAYLIYSGDSSRASRHDLTTQIGRGIVEADRIELRGKGLDRPRVLTRSGANWQITEPMLWKANYFAINRILNQLQFIEEEASFTVDEIERTGQTLADYGLKEPLVELILSEGEDSIQLSIGTMTEIGNNVYLLGPDRKRIFVVGREVIDGLLVDLADLLNRDIFEIPVFEVTELSVQIKSTLENNTGDLKVRLAKTAEQWRFEAPLSAEADPDLVASTINQLASVKVDRFIDTDSNSPVAHGLERPFMSITLHGNKRRQTLIIGNPVPTTTPTGIPQYYARLENTPIVFIVDARPFENLLQAQESLRERNFMSFDDKGLNAIHIDENGRQIRLQKIETGDWQVLESASNTRIQPRRADPGVMKTLINDIQQMQAKAFLIDSPTAVDLERLGFNAPRRRISLHFDSGQILILELAHPEEENEKLYARTGNKESIFEVERRPTLQMFPLNTLHYRNRIIETLPIAALIRKVTLKNRITGETIVEHRASSQDEWADVLQQLEAQEAEALTTLLNTLRQFEVESYQQDGFGDSYVLDSETSIPWTYELSAEIFLPGGDQKQTRRLEYVFTDRLSGTIQIGGSNQHQIIFRLKLDLIEAIYVLSENMVLPPEAEGKDIPAPVMPEPIPEPVSAPTPPG